MFNRVYKDHQTGKPKEYLFQWELRNGYNAVPIEFSLPATGGIELAVGTEARRDQVAVAILEDTVGTIENCLVQAGPAIIHD